MKLYPTTSVAELQVTLSYSNALILNECSFSYDKVTNGVFFKVVGSTPSNLELSYKVTYSDSTVVETSQSNFDVTDTVDINFLNTTGFGVIRYHVNKSKTLSNIQILSSSSVSIAVYDCALVSKVPSSKGLALSGAKSNLVTGVLYSGMSGNLTAPNSPLTADSLYNLLQMAGNLENKFFILSKSTIESIFDRDTENLLESSPNFTGDSEISLVENIYTTQKCSVTISANTYATLFADVTVPILGIGYKFSFSLFKTSSAITSFGLRAVGLDEVSEQVGSKNHTRAELEFTPTTSNQIRLECFTYFSNAVSFGNYYVSDVYLTKKSVLEYAQELGVSTYFKMSGDYVKILPYLDMTGSESISTNVPCSSITSFYLDFMESAQSSSLFFADNTHFINYQYSDTGCTFTGTFVASFDYSSDFIRIGRKTLAIDFSLQRLYFLRETVSSRFSNNTSSSINLFRGFQGRVFNVKFDNNYLVPASYKGNLGLFSLQTESFFPIN